MDRQSSDWIGQHIGQGESASLFAPNVKVWSEMAVRAAIMRALEGYEKGRHANSTDRENSR